ncbi:MAG: alkaline phosphatase family protein [Planctomycetes bacterium]|nr:alkaline phosphatase family protein [Planctomycetota bacterium]
MKVLILGLDGVPRGLLERLARAGVMPSFARLIGEGTLHDLRASIPEISSVSWTSFMTGANPGIHGVFGFTDLVPGTMRIRFPRFSDLEVPTFWDRLGRQGLRSVVLNQPSTYPVRPIPGALVAGFVALDLDRAVYPARHLARLEAMRYRVDVDSRRAQSDRTHLLEELEATLAAREAAVDYFWTEERWDVLELVITGTDRLQHFLWDALEAAEHPLHERVLAYYRAVDGLAGRLVERFRAEHPAGRFFALSDHGFTRVRQEVRLNAWLEAEGYLAFQGEERGALSALAPSTRVFALDPGRLYLRPASEALRTELIERLTALGFGGEPVVRAVHRREAIYHGPLAERGPDLVVQAHDGFDLKGTLKADSVFAAPATMSGMHNSEAFLLADHRVGDNLDIAEVAGHIEALFP